MVRVRLAKEVKIKDRRIEELVRKLELIIIYMTIKIFKIILRKELKLKLPGKLRCVSVSYSSLPSKDKDFYRCKN